MTTDNYMDDDAFRHQAEFAKHVLGRARDLQNDINKIATTQEEVITWHKYPDEKPTKLATCLRSLRSTKKRAYKIVDWCRWLSGGWYEKEHDYPIEFETVAWAELPKGWQK